MPEKRNQIIIIIGAGASGLMAAISAAEHGADVLVLEHMKSAGNKLLLTGAGRCNYTNTDVCTRHYHSLEETLRLLTEADSQNQDNALERFVSAVLAAFSCDDCIDAFRRLGIEPEIRHYRFDETGYVYPKDQDARGVKAALLKRAEELGVRFCFCAKLALVRFMSGGAEKRWEVQYHAPENGHTAAYKVNCDAVILAAGSNAYPVTGSDSSLYPFLKDLGLKFHSFLPALCALYSKDELLREWKGVRADGTVTLVIGTKAGRKLSLSESGEIQLNEHSLSGIPVMQLSAVASAALKTGLPISLKTDIEMKDKPGLHHVFEIHRTAGFDRAQCCAGGISLSEIDPADMQCRRLPGLYVCGELLDVHGDCGGYNLHFAWACGRIAGLAAANNDNTGSTTLT